MRILVVQESDWIERNPHQQHHLFDRLSARGHEVRVIDYPIDWRKDEGGGIMNPAGSTGGSTRSGGCQCGCDKTSPPQGPGT